MDTKDKGKKMNTWNLVSTKKNIIKYDNSI